MFRHIPDEVLKDSHLLVQSLADNHITRIVLVPSLLRVLLDTHADLQNQLPQLKIWVSSGETLSKALAQRFHQCMPESILLNLYGSSEVAADATWYNTNLMKTEYINVPIGRPIANTYIYLLDSHLQPVPIGVPGELYVGGVGLARGYLNRPELTTENFIPNPFSDTPKARLYKTGDLARYLADGNIEFLGRTDYQVKIRGFRVELSEVEMVLSQYPALKESVVLVREDIPNEKRLVAYIVPEEQQSPTVSELHGFLKVILPDYMLPSAFVILDTLPLLPNGKVNRQALPVPDRSRPVLEETLVLPRNSVEERLAEIWTEILELDQVGIHDDFFELGGYSLLATQVVSQISGTFQVELPLRSLFETPTIAELAIKIMQSEAGQINDEMLAQILAELDSPIEG